MRDGVIEFRYGDKSVLVVALRATKTVELSKMIAQIVIILGFDHFLIWAGAERTGAAKALLF